MPNAPFPQQVAVDPVNPVLEEFFVNKLDSKISNYTWAKAPKMVDKTETKYSTILREKNERIRALQIDLHEYSGCFKQNDLVLIINRVAKENDLPRFAASSKHLTKTQFANLLTNYLYNVTAKEEVDRFVE